MTTHYPHSRRALLAATLCVASLSQAQQHAHSHGQMAMNVAVDAQTITIGLDVPLDNFLGFERAPRTDAERRRVADTVARLRAADGLFQIDPRAGCSLSRVALESQVLGLDPAAPAGQAAAKAGAHQHGDDAHADIAVSITFACPKADQARHIDVKLFDAFKRIRKIDAQVASAQGQSRQTLTRAAPRLAWGR